ncbi:hypothetical protein CG471_02030 [Sphingobium sp. IP1]|jgi:hypothetical protein|uniref:HK97 gp10 family phage protein n=1 Tax=Sphingobium sp. IP1 TaxID=2021637 RepID=UPI000C071146|nr:HK97 gp10 family phage protein [Sphingobium sp. IP1]PHP21371.1 hypothetical protein CG471_02030 [Sphingobium sp. IP1]
MVKITGLREINEVLRSLPRGTGKAALTRFGKKRLEPMRDAAKAKAPKDSGELADSIIISTRQGSPGQRKRRFQDKAAVEVYMGPSKDQHGHAVPQEFGSINNPPAGYMRGAWDEHSDALLTNLAEDLGAEVNATAARHRRKLARNAR